MFTFTAALKPLATSSLDISGPCSCVYFHILKPLATSSLDISGPTKLLFTLRYLKTTDASIIWFKICEGKQSFAGPEILKTTDASIIWFKVCESNQQLCWP